MALSTCAHCGSANLQALADNRQCLDCGGLTRIDTGERVEREERVVAPSPAAQRRMHAPGSNDGVHPEHLQVGAASWPSHVDPEARVETDA
jgi:hypothetical protein